MQVIPDVKASSLMPFIRKHVESTATVATDGWNAFHQVSEHFEEHLRHVSVGPRNGTFHPVLNAVHLLISNLKTWLRGSFHGVTRKYLPAYVAEFMYRFNRRRSPPDIFGWVMRRLMARDTITLCELKATADLCA